MRMPNTAQYRYLRYTTFSFATMLVIALCVAASSSTAYAKKKKAKHGTIKILTTPGGFPLDVDGKAQGETTTDYRHFDLNPGIHTIAVSLPDGQRWVREINLAAGRIKCVAVNYTPGVPVSVVSPCPFPISLSARSTVNEGELITYTSDVKYTGNFPLNFIWTISPANARILSGAGTQTIEVDSTGLPGQTLTATLLVDDGSKDPACSRSVQASTFVAAQPLREKGPVVFDVCLSCSYNDQKARLDNLIVELQSDPSVTAYILAYGGRTSRNGQADRLGARARDYLVNHRRINTSRIVVLNGGFREEDSVELWIVPSGATLPQVRATVQPGDVRPPRGAKARQFPQITTSQRR